MTRPLPSPRKCNFTLEKHFAPSPKKQFTAVIHLSKIQSATSSKRDRHPIKEFLSNQQKLLQPIWGSEDPTRPAEEALVFSSYFASVSFLSFLSINSISFCIDLLYPSYNHKKTPSANVQEVGTQLNQISIQCMEVTT